ncbi:MAG: ABC transporter permease [Proteobacteria bacterium]|nr:ABC transporter permease [Pseudomonadota bacterium]
MYCVAQRQADRVELELRGEWRVAALPAIELELAAVDAGGQRRLRVDARAAQFDLSGAWLLHDYLARIGAAGVSTEFAGEPPPALALIARTLGSETASVGDEALSRTAWLDPAVAVEGLGRKTVAGWRLIESLLAFLGHASYAVGRAFVSVRRWRPTSITRHVYDTGITAIPIVALIAFLIAVILAYMGAQQLRKFGADIFVVDLVTVGVLRELGVLLTAIIVAGRSGSAFAAEIGAMRLNEEVDALQAIGVDPIEVLVLPRVIGLVIALPLLTVIADGIGLVGGGLLCHTLLGMPLAQYLNRANEAIASTTFWVGIIKAPVFALLIALAGTWCGLRVRGSSRELGRLTTLAVVQAIFFVILADALFAVMFMEMDI